MCKKKKNRPKSLENVTAIKHIPVVDDTKTLCETHPGLIPGSSSSFVCLPCIT